MQKIGIVGADSFVDKTIKSKTDQKTLNDVI